MAIQWTRMIGLLLLTSWIGVITVAVVVPGPGCILTAEELARISGGAPEDCTEEVSTPDACGYCYQISEVEWERCDPHYNEACVTTTTTGCIACEQSYQDCPGFMYTYASWPDEKNHCADEKRVASSARDCSRLYGDASTWECTEQYSCGSG